MKVIVKPHNIQVVSTPVNEQEVNVTKVEFEFSEEITDEFVKEAYFTLDDETYKQVIVNNMCEIPSEVLTKVGTIELGVVAYYADPVNNELIRYNPKPGYFTSWEGSLRDAENSEPITPSEMEQFETALQDGLETLDNALDDLQEKVDSGYFDGEDGITPTIGNNGNWYLGDTDTGKPSRGATGATGQTGQTGPAGRDGTDGVSPTAIVTKSGSTATITITDKNGTTTTTINDGVNGINGTNGRDGVIQYTAGDNITIENNVISATVPQIDLSNYYTKGDMKTYYIAENFGDIYISGLKKVTDTTLIQKFIDVLNDAYTKGLSAFELVVYNTGGNWEVKQLRLIPVWNMQQLQVVNNYFQLVAMPLPTNNMSSIFNSYINCFIYCQFVNGRFEQLNSNSSVRFNGVDTNLLKTNNSVSYTPTPNSYNPAHTKYVESYVNSKIWIGTQSEYDNLGTYSNDTVYFIKES